MMYGLVAQCFLLLAKDPTQAMGSGGQRAARNERHSMNPNPSWHLAKGREGRPPPSVLPKPQQSTEEAARSLKPNNALTPRISKAAAGVPSTSIDGCPTGRSATGSASKFLARQANF